MNKQILNLALILFLSTSLTAQEVYHPLPEPVQDSTETVSKTTPKETTGYIYVLRHETKKGKTLYDPRVNTVPIDTFLAHGYRIVRFYKADQNPAGRFWENFKQGISTAVEIIKVWFDLRDKFDGEDDEQAAKE